MFLVKIKELKRIKSSCEIEFRIINESGELIWYKLIAGKVNDQSSKNFWLAYVEIIHDKKIAIELREQLINETVDEERRRIAMELHDDLGQSLVSLNLMLSMIDQETSGKSEILNRCKELAVNSVSKTKSLIYNLAPPELEEGISRTLESFFGRMTEYSSDIEFHFSNKLSESRKISTDISFNIFRIIQEFTSNSMKYSQCKNVFCLIKSIGSKIQVVLSDDGIGFEIDKVKRGFGISNFQKRANLIGASYNLQSEPGSGTILTLEF
jgi:signal transduction histidine kinase